MSSLSISNLTLKRGGATVLRDINLELAAGETLAIIGPSGSGKSSLLRCVNRLDEIDGGSIHLDGASIYDLPVTDLRRKVGLIFQKTAAFEGSVADNINWSAAIRGENLGRAQILDLMRGAFLEPELADQPASALSGGQEQRLAIARALALKPSLLMLDEPTSALDPIATARIEESLLRWQRTTGGALIWVSHSIDQARRVGTHAILLDGGRVIRQGKAAIMLDPATGDRRALAFAEGIEAAMQAD